MQLVLKMHPVTLRLGNAFSFDQLSAFQSFKTLYLLFYMINTKRIYNAPITRVKNKLESEARLLCLLMFLEVKKNHVLRFFLYFCYF